MEPGKEAVEQSEEVAGKNNDKQGTKTLEFRMVRLRRRHFRDGEYMQKILELLSEVEKKRKLVQTVRSDSDVLLGLPISFSPGMGSEVTKTRMHKPFKNVFSTTIHLPDNFDEDSGN